MLKEASYSKKKRFKTDNQSLKKKSKNIKEIKKKESVPNKIQTINNKKKKRDKIIAKKKRITNLTKK